MAFRGTSGPSRPLSYTETGANIPSLQVPSQIYAKMFLTGTKADVENQLLRLRTGHSLLDNMKERLGDLTRTISRHDQQQIRDYAEAVREMEQQLVDEEAWINRPKPVTEPAPTEGYPSPFADLSDSIGRAKVMFKLAKLAVQTDSTRVVSIFIRGSDAKPPIAGISQEHHDVTHHGRSPEKMKAFHEPLSSLKETQEGGSSRRSSAMPSPVNRFFHL